MPESLDRHCVTEQRDTSGYVAADFYFARCITYQANLSRDIVVEQTSLLLCKLGTHPKQILTLIKLHIGIGHLRNSFHLRTRRCLGETFHVVITYLMSGEQRQSGLRPFVEALKKRNAHRVAYLPVILVIVSIMRIQIGIFPERQIFLSILIAEHMLGLLITECPYKTRYRHKRALHG